MVKEKSPSEGSKTVTKTKKRSFKRLFAPLFAIGRYFKGSWAELKEVRWPNRGATWSMVLAVLLFTGLFVILIILLDAGFEQLFNLIIK